jgi:hypothetical protein
MYLDTLASDAIKKSPKNNNLSVNLFGVIGIKDVFMDVTIEALE